MVRISNIFFITLVFYLNILSMTSSRTNMDKILIFSFAEGGSVENVDLLLNHGISVNYCDSETLQTPIFRAVKKNNTEVANYLLFKGAEVSCVDRKGFSPLDYCFVAKKFDFRLFFRLLAAGSRFHCNLDSFKTKDDAIIFFERSMNFSNECMQNILHLACRFGDYNLLKFLLNFIENPNYKDLWDRTPLDLLKHYHGKFLSKYKDLPMIWDI